MPTPLRTLPRWSPLLLAGALAAGGAAFSALPALAAENDDGAGSSSSAVVIEQATPSPDESVEETPVPDDSVEQFPPDDSVEESPSPEPPAHLTYGRFGEPYCVDGGGAAREAYVFTDAPEGRAILLLYYIDGTEFYHQVYAHTDAETGEWTYALPIAEEGVTVSSLWADFGRRNPDGTVQWGNLNVSETPFPEECRATTPTPVPTPTIIPAAVTPASAQLAESGMDGSAVPTAFGAAVVLVAVGAGLIARRRSSLKA